MTCIYKTYLLCHVEGSIFYKHNGMVMTETPSTHVMLTEVEASHRLGEGLSCEIVIKVYITSGLPNTFSRKVLLISF